MYSQMKISSKSNKQEQWQELLARVHELAKTTSDENVQLVKKVKELEVELDVWKQAVSNGRNAEKNIALCVIDGTRSVFSTNYIAEGEEGGRKAGEEIIWAMTDYLSNDRSLQDNKPRLSISIFVRQTRLRNDLVIGDFCTPEQFDDFFVDHLQIFAGLPQTVRIFFSGGNGSEYLSVLPILESCTASSKLVILRSHGSVSFGRAQTPSVMLPGLFTKTGQSSPSTPLPPHSPSPFHLAEADDPDTNVQRRQAFIDPDLPLYKQNPPPCNEYYLMESCSKEVSVDCGISSSRSKHIIHINQGRCRYSHEYDLTDEHLNTLAKSARQSPCWFSNNDRQCPFGETCCWGHVCPFGVKCLYSAKEKCRFKGSGMHRPRGDSRVTSSKIGYLKGRAGVCVFVLDKRLLF
ncbi:hypothetical protein BGW80DRAFT_1560700 [Lactifluus volemus]|nr:hypothetical protein BGW80DRAFT_1560700 [Lactifluus volemus]